MQNTNSENEKEKSFCNTCWAILLCTTTVTVLEPTTARQYQHIDK